MSILIKGMEMPEDCAMLLKIFPDGRVGVPVHLTWTGTMVVKDAEAFPVPPHGRLINADALRALAYQRQKEMGIACCVDALDIALAPTVIEAEEGE